MTRIATLSLLLLSTGTWMLASCGSEEPAPPAQASAATKPAQVLERAGELARAEQVDAAAELLEDALAQHPEDDVLRVALAQAHVLREEVPSAVRLLREGLSARPASGLLAVELANVYLSVEQPGPAEQVLLAARTAGAGDGDDLAYRLGVIHARLGRFEQAAAEFERATLAGTDPVAVGYSLSMLAVQAGRWSEASERLEGLLALDPTRMDVVRELGRARLATNRSDKDLARRVIADLDRVLVENPEDWYAFEILGDAYMTLEDYPAALFHYTEALRFGNNPPRVEDRYRSAVLAQRAADRAAGIPVEPLPEPEWEQPALPASLEHLDGFWRRPKPR